MLFVTGLFDISSREKNEKRLNPDEYISYFKSLIKSFTKYNFIVYLDTDLIRYKKDILEISSINKNITLKMISIEDLPLWKYVSKINECNMCHSYDKNKYTPLYSLITNSKFYLLKLAIELFPEENCFSWIDFGCFHYKENYLNIDKYISDFISPNEENLRFFQVSEMYNIETSIEKYFNEYPKVKATLFGGNKHKLLELYNFVNKIYLEFIDSGRLIFEEHILTYYLSLHYEECDVYYGDTVDFFNNIKIIRDNQFKSFKIIVCTYRNRDGRDPTIDEIPHELRKLYRKISLF